MRISTSLCASALLGAALLAPDLAHADDPGNEYRLTIFPTYKINDEWTGIGYLGYVTTPEINTVTTYLGTGGIWHFKPRWDMWAVLMETRTKVDGSLSNSELRPLLGLQYALSPWGKVKPFDLFRAEYRMIDKVDAADSNYVRLRNRFGFTVPFGSKQGPGSWYGLVDAEAFYRFDKNFSDLARLRGGIGYIASPRVRIEFIAHAQFKRADQDSAFHWTDNIWRINIKVAKDTGLLDRLVGADADADSD
jgi:hypothetical protein